MAQTFPVSPGWTAGVARDRSDDAGCPDPTAGWTHSWQAFYRQRPVDATAIGMHDHDSQLPDLSAAGLADRETRWPEALLEQASRLPVAALDEARQIDLRLARGVLDNQRWELASSHSPEHDPTAYTSAAAHGVLSLLRYPTQPLEARVEHLGARLLAMPKLFESARVNLSSSPGPMGRPSALPTAAGHWHC